jgi:hypothetical protein
VKIRLTIFSGASSTTRGSSIGIRWAEFFVTHWNLPGSHWNLSGSHPNAFGSHRNLFGSHENLSSKRQVSDMNHVINSTLSFRAFFHDIHSDPSSVRGSAADPHRFVRTSIFRCQIPFGPLGKLATSKLRTSRRQTSIKPVRGARKNTRSLMHNVQLSRLLAEKPAKCSPPCHPPALP